MKRVLKSLALPLIGLTVILSVSLFLQSSQNLTSRARIDVPRDFYKSHILGGFSIDNPERAGKAATEDIQVAFQYGQPPSEHDPLGQKLISLHMRVVDGYIASYLHYYECARTTTVNPPAPLDWKQYCQRNTHPELADESAFLANIEAHLRQVKNNQLIVGYWVLDDWVPWDAGSARQLLAKVHALIQHYTPGRPAICGFGGSVSLRTPGWDDWVADNFSSQSCDMVGLYIYVSSQVNIPSDVYDWSMSATLSAAFKSLQKRGWDITKQPLIGIGQAFGGPRPGKNSYWITPNATNIETQSESFCEHGASGIAFYGWDDSEFVSTTQTPMNNIEIEKGIRNGITACQQYWLNERRAELNGSRFLHTTEVNIQ